MTTTIDHLDDARPHAGAMDDTAPPDPEVPERSSGRRRFSAKYKADVHHGRADEIRDRRGVVLLDAYAEHPERFVRKIPTPPAIPTVAWINQPGKEATDSLNP